MTEGLWERVSAVVERVVETPVGTRAALLDALCGDDLAFRHEVESLVAAHDTGGDRFDRPAAELLGGIRSERTGETVAAGQRIGPYQVVREIGRGGMGTVFEAFRADDDFRKRVALKTLAIGPRGEPAVRRFRQERRILARLEHRHIAALVDGGVLPDGVPYFAMELIEGEPIDRYCAGRGLSVTDRLQLLRQVTGAVQFAHQNLVVHRDLKPSNVLVTADGTVKLLDFGIAKLLGPEDDDSDPDLTQTGGSPYTPAYASPEQLRGDPITTASDIHALGVVLFQVLTGRHPFRDGDPSQGTLRRRIEDEPPPPTGVGPDLDAIVGKALHKEAARRYASAEQLGDDLSRYLEGLPVRARPDTFGYRVGKLVRRNRMAAAALTIAAISLVVTAVTSRHQARVASAERDRAQLEAAKANRITTFVQEMLRSADPREAGPDLTVAAALAAATARADSSLVADSAVLASVLTAIGRSYLGLGRYDDAEPPLRRALALRRALGRDAETATNLHELGRVYLERGDLAPAESLFRQALATARAPAIPDSAGIAPILSDLGDLLQYAGDLSGAAAVHREALAVRTRLEGVRGAGVAASLNNIAVIEGQLGRWVVAESLGRAALAIVIERHGRRHPDVGAGLNALAFAVQSQQRAPEAESLYRQALDVRLEALGPRHPETARTYMNLGWLFFDTGRYPDALAQAERVLALRGSVLPDEHPAVGSTLLLKGRSLLAMGRSVVAERHLREALGIRQGALPPGHWLIAASQSAVADALIAQRRFGEAESLLLAALPVLETSRGMEHEQTRLARERLARLYRASGRGPPARSAR